MVESGLVLGVDVGWSANKKTTGACVLRWSAKDATIRPVRLATANWDGLSEMLRPHEAILALAVDGPVRGTLDEIGTYRDAEMMLTRGFAERIGKPGQSSSGNGRKLNAAANEAARGILAKYEVAPASHQAKIHKCAIVEAFPTSFLGVMLDDGPAPPHGARSDAYFLHLLGPNGNRPPVPSTDRFLGLLDRLLPGRCLQVGHLGAIVDHEERAAAVCAFTALCVVARKYVAVGDPTNGYIVLPPRADAGCAGLQPWAWNIIKDNRRHDAVQAIIVEDGL